MYLFNYATPPLQPNKYRMEMATDVGFDGGTQSLEDKHYFEVVGPRFALPPGDVGGVFPPRNGHGPFQDNLAHIAIKRRTLPWERSLDKGKPIAAPSDGQVLAADYPSPWMALLIFEEGEYTLLQNVALETVVPADVFDRLGKPANILCEAVQADKDLVLSIMPSKQELQLLTHVRWVNVDDRELSAEGSGGWFSVVMTNRVPRPDKKCRACLVSLEERSDLVKADAPASEYPAATLVDSGFVKLDSGDPLIQIPKYLEAAENSQMTRKFSTPKATTKLVVLYSWQFTCEGDGTFFNLMQNLDVAMIGKVKKEGEPALTDTAHLKMTLHDRGGATETTFYRGPLAPFELTRDTLGPYHSADQCRRAAPEAGVEDISYAAAFEVGRLLAAADARLAQELMRWRRQAFKQSARASTLLSVDARFKLNLPPPLEQKLHVALPPIVAEKAIEMLVSGAPPIADRYGLNAASKAIGMSAENLSEVWGLASVSEAQIYLGGDAGTFGLEVAEPEQTPRANTTLEAEVADTGSADQLKLMRDRMIANTNIRMGGK
jgi:hypothetical protein